ncbi:MAG TPA: hypothetical protein VMM92_03245 [Thermoanaerobaculia bacterium]|nr:hypothetical protein [Thermoanaerobaculia bacterium]
MRGRGALAFLLLVLSGSGVTSAPGAPPASKPPEARWTQSVIDYSADLDRIFVAYPDASQVIALDAQSGAAVWRRQVGRRPEHLELVTVQARGALLVSCSSAGEVWALDPGSGRVLRRMAVGPSPRGFALVGGRYLVTALYALHQISVWDLAADRERERVAVPRFPTTVRYLERRHQVLVGHFFSGRLTVLQEEHLDRIDHQIDGDPHINQVAALLPDRDEERLYLPHVLSNSDFPAVHMANAVLPAISTVDLAAGQYLGNRLDIAFIDRPVNGPVALALLRPLRPLHNEEAVISVNSRSNDLSIFALRSSLALGHVEVGRYPVGIAVDVGHQRAYVANANEHTVSVVDLAAFRELKRWPFGDEVLPPQVARGRDLFCDAASPRMVMNHWISCSNCHPDGHSDGRVWSLPGKPSLRTKDLHELADTLPAGWRATADELQDEEIFIREFQRGSGLSPSPPHPALGAPNAGLSSDLDALAAYVYSLRFEPSPYLEAGHLSAAAERGRGLFLSPALGCTACHPPPRYTVSSLHHNPLFESLLDPEPSPVSGLDVPSLLGLYLQPGLLHDARATFPAEIFARWNGAGRHGKTAQLSAGELRDLEAFLLSLPFDRPRSSPAEQ